MGQGQSAPPPPPRTHEELVKELANRFAVKCFTSLELYSLKDNFKSLADTTTDTTDVTDTTTDTATDTDAEAGKTEDAPDATHDGQGALSTGRRQHRVVRYLKEDTVARFLALPDILGVSPVVFQMLSYLAAFPFLDDAPAMLGLEQLVIVVTLLTDRYERVLAHGSSDRQTLLYRSLAVHDRRLHAEDRKEAQNAQAAQTAQAADAAADEGAGERQRPAGSGTGFAVDAPVDDDDDGDDGDDDDDAPDGRADCDDDLVLAAFDALDYASPSATAATRSEKAKAAAGDEPDAEAARTARVVASLHGARIPADNFRKLVMLLLVVAPLGPQESLTLHAGHFVGDALDSLREAAQCVLATFVDVETAPGIKYAPFHAVLPVCFPFLFSGFSALFERFLFSKNLDLSRMRPGAAAHDEHGAADIRTRHMSTVALDRHVRRSSSIATTASEPALDLPPTEKTRAKATTTAPQPPPPPPLVVKASDRTILNLSLLSQLSFFLPGSELFHRLRLLYAGDNDGFSMGSFESKVFNWRAPTILLVKGTRISDAPRGGQEATFAAALPPRRFPHGSGRRSPHGPTDDNSNGNGIVVDDDDDDDDETLIFGAYVHHPWQMTFRECFGDSETVLFQLSPVHDVFGASTLNRDYVAFVKPTPANHHAGGIGFGCPSPSGAAAKANRKQGISGSGVGSGGAGSNHGHVLTLDGVLPLGPLSLMIDANLEFGVMTHDRGHRGLRGGSGGGGAFHASTARAFSFQDRFRIEALEVWGCGGSAEAQAQAERWAWEAREAEARRRINLGTGDIEADRALLEMAGIIGGNRSGGSMR